MVKYGSKLKEPTKQQLAKIKEAVSVDDALDIKVNPLDGTEISSIPHDLEYLSTIQVKKTKAQRIKPGTNNKIAIIGNGMNIEDVWGVVPYAKELEKLGYDVELFAGNLISKNSRREFKKLIKEYANENGRVPAYRFLKSLPYRENKAWAQKLINDDYTVIDIGNPGKRDFSIFYGIEKKIIFGNPYKSVFKKKVGSNEK